MTNGQDSRAGGRSREIELVAGTPPGGGQDRPARALIEVLEKHRLLDVPVKLTNIAGRGGGNAWDYLRQHAGDAHVLAINSPTIISNKLLGVAGTDYSDLTPLANLYTEYPIFIVRAASPIADIGALIRRLRDAASVPIALATAIGNPNHIALARLTRHAGGDVKALKIEVFDSARYAIAHVLEGKAELGVITAVSAVPELTAGALRTLTLSAPQRLGGVFDGVPTLIESGVDCKVGMWRGLIAPGGVAPEAVAFWTGVLAAATATQEWRAELAKKYWANTFLTGAQEMAFLDDERTVTTAALRDIGVDHMSAWRPERAVQIVAGTPPGGGLDRVARALARAIAEAKLLDVPMEVVNVAGNGARRAWTHFVDQHPGNPHVLSISSPNLTTDYLVGIADFEHTKYTAIATLVTEYIAFAVRADSKLKPAPICWRAWALHRERSPSRCRLRSAIPTMSRWPS